MKMICSSARRLALLALLLASASAARATYEVPDSAYAAPANYYANAAATDATLINQLQTIISTGFVHRSYDSVAAAFPILDAYPGKPGYMREIYTGAAVTAYGSREHQWVNSRLPDTDPNGDYFNLRPLNQSTNSTRGNLNYGGPNLTGSAGAVTINSVKYWFPGDLDKGDVARSLFYMATKWKSEGLMLVNGNPTSGNQMGDLNSLLHWHYQDGVDNFERRRNDLIYDNYQHNRNPYIDHPEYVWAAFGGGNNNSQVTLASSDSKVTVTTSTTTGTSTAQVNLGRVFTGTTLGSATIVIDKAGSNPTTYDITTSGSATTAAAGVGQTVDYEHQTRAINVGLNASTATAGHKSGAVTVNNTDLTSSGAGHGSADGNDTINIQADVVDHARASLNPSSQLNAITLDFGTLHTGDAAGTLSFTLFNLESTAGYTAMLDLDSISFTGDGVFSSNLLATQNILAGTGESFAITLSTLTAGSFSGTYYLGCSDEDLAGAQSYSPLIVNVIGNVAAVPEPATFLLLGLCALGLVARRKVN